MDILSTLPVANDICQYIGSMIVELPIQDRVENYAWSLDFFRDGEADEAFVWGCYYGRMGIITYFMDKVSSCKVFTDALMYVLRYGCMDENVLHVLFENISSDYILHNILLIIDRAACYFHMNIILTLLDYIPECFIPVLHTSLITYGHIEAIDIFNLHITPKWISYVKYNHVGVIYYFKHVLGFTVDDMLKYARVYGKDDVIDLLI